LSQICQFYQPLPAPQFMRSESPELPAPASPRLARLYRQQTPGWQLLRIESPQVTEFHVTLAPVAGDAPTAHFARLAEALRPANATVVRALAFGSLAVAKSVTGRLRDALHDPDMPVTWIEGAACDGRPLAGLQLMAIAGTEVHHLGHGPAQARVWSDGLARHCVLGQLEPTEVGAPRPAQARETMARLQAGLAEAGMTMHHLVRTWFFLDDILGWYDDFNRVRNDCFARTELRPGSVPASTGVSGRNPAGSAVALAAWAVQRLSAEAGAVRILPSPRQCPAPAYGSAFSRAVEIGDETLRRVLVSGTASIEPGGRTAHAGTWRPRSR
jgi:enamine deaminase RidA (YjgF/YER057c/UK114 family)